jgi:hypothetical protein
MRRNKKGSLDISIQAIVILVMAMAVLGLGLGFIRGLIGKGQAQFEEAIGSVELDNPPTAEDPFTSDFKIKVKSTGENSFKAGVYNDGTFSATTYVKINMGSCVPSLPAGTTGGPLILRSLSQTIAEGQYGSFRGIIEGNGMPTGTYVCKITAEGYTTAEATTKVSPAEYKDKQIEVEINT